MKLLLLEIFAAFFASVLVMEAASYSYRRHSNALPSEYVCRRHDICRWALCPWTQQLTAPSSDCQYLEQCYCPTECQRTVGQLPTRESINIFLFRCM